MILVFKSDIFTQPKVYDAKTKSLMCQNGLFTICLSLVHDVLGMSKSTSTYCWSHLFTILRNITVIDSMKRQQVHSCEY